MSAFHKKTFFSAVVLLFAVCRAVQAGRVFDVREFGAAGDGVSKDTAAIQKALDACAGTSGRVKLPRGTYLTGSVFIGDDTDLHLEEGAVLLGSPDLADYNALDAYPQNFGSVKEGWGAGHLVLAIERKNVKITGKGVIDGNGRSFFDTETSHRGKVTWRHGGRNAKGRAGEQRRPGQEIVFVECKGVEVRDVTFRDMSCWSCFFHGCENVVVGGVAVRNGFMNLNTDGFDVDSCRNVQIGDCDIETGDDAIAIRGNPSRLRNASMACENIRVSNIVCKVQADAVRVGVGNGVIRNVRISDMKVLQSGRGIHVQCCFGTPVKKSGKVGVDISDIIFERIEIADSHTPVCVTAGSSRSTAHLRNIKFRDIVSSTSHPPSVVGMGRTRPCDIEFSNCVFSTGVRISGAYDNEALPPGAAVGDLHRCVKKADRISFTSCKLINKRRK